MAAQDTDDEYDLTGLNPLNQQQEDPGLSNDPMLATQSQGFGQVAGAVGAIPKATNQYFANAAAPSNMQAAVMTASILQKQDPSLSNEDALKKAHAISANAQSGALLSGMGNVTNEIYNAANDVLSESALKSADAHNMDPDELLEKIGDIDTDKVLQNQKKMAIEDFLVKRSQAAKTGKEVGYQDPYKKTPIVSNILGYAEGGSVFGGDNYDFSDLIDPNATQGTTDASLALSHAPAPASLPHNVSEVGPQDTQVALPPQDQQEEGGASAATVPIDASGLNMSGLSVLDKDQYNQTQVEQKYGSIPQQALAGVEGALQGVAGPLAPLAEEMTGLTTGKDILGRATTNPFLHATTEAGAFGLASIFGDELGLPGAVTAAGELGVKVLPGIAGIKGAAQLATIAASNELSRMVEGDPNQTLGSAAVSVGLSGVLGGLGGAILEKYNPFKTYAANKLRSKATDWISSFLGEAASLAAGIGFGHAVGHEVIGGFLAERTLAPIFTALARPFAEKLTSTAAAEAAYDYVYAANAGQKTIENTTKALFGKSFESLQLKELLPPSDSERSKLQAYLLKQDDPQNSLSTGQSIAHYLPSHATEAASLAKRAVDYFKSLEPKTAPVTPLDKPAPVDKASQSRYNRALDVAEKPLMVLGQIQKGTLLPQDVQTINTLFPGLHESIVKNLTAGIIENKEAAQEFPYAKRQAMNMFIGGAPLDTTFTPTSAQAIMASAMPQQMAQQESKAKKSGATESTLKQVNKVDSLYQLKDQAREANRKA